MFGINLKIVVTIIHTLWILFALNASTTAQTCPLESNEQESWPETNNPECVWSNPVCLNQNMEVLTRCCNPDGYWADAPNCLSYQNTITNPCPENLDWKSNICILVIENSVYPPQCPYVETLPFAQYVSLIDDELFPIWMPIKRYTGYYGIDLLRWMEPTTAYKTTFDVYQFDGTVTNKNCLIYYNESFVEAVFCDEKHTAICAYTSLPNKFQSFCSQALPNSCIQSDYSSFSKCFCQGVTQDFSLAPKAEFLQPYQNLLYSSLKDTCYIGLERSNGTYIWKNSNTNLNYSNWAETATFHENYKYGVITPNGWSLTETESDNSCVLYEVDVPTYENKIVLESVDAGKFMLTLTHSNNWLFDEDLSGPVVHCFTDAASTAIISKLDVSDPIVSAEKAIFYFQEHEDGPGYYWCEAFAYPDVAAQSSNKYLLRYNDTYTEEYVVILMKNYTKGTNPITEAKIEEYQKILADQVLALEDISTFQVRIYKIISVDEDNCQVVINFHLVHPSKSKPLTNYGTLRKKMEQDLVNFTFVDILGVDSCVGVQTSGSITWPVTPLNSLAKPREGYCIGNDGSIVNRHCSGNYIDGAKWLDLEQPCTIQQSTNASINLTNILNMNSPKDYMDQVVEISKNTLGLLPLDVDLISYFLEQVLASDNINLNSVMLIVDHMMEVPENIVKQAQMSFNATDRLIHHLQAITRLSGYIGKLTGENIIILSDYVKDCNLSTLVTDDDSADKDCNVLDINDIPEISTLKVSLMLSESLMTRLLREDSLNTRMIVTIYKTSRLFNEMSHNRKYTDVILGVTFPLIEEDVTDEISVVYSVSDSDIEDIRCSYWEYELQDHKGYWETAKQNISDDNVICIYNQSAHFTLIRRVQFNITYALESVIYSEDDLSDKLKQTFALLNDHHENFNADDVRLVSCLLHLAAESDEDNLELVADIVNTVVIIPKEILEKSQESYNATGKILFYFEQILEKSNTTQTVMRQHVYAVVQLLNEDLLYGFSFDHCDENCNFNLYHETITREEISKIEKLDTALLISPEMLLQLLHHDKPDFVPKIASIIFFKDSLFLEDYIDPKIKTKVVGVSFPDFNEPQEGDITLFYKLNENISLDYTCSVYDTVESTSIKGFWNSESVSVAENGLQMCEFWKSTYFALIYNLVNFTSSLESMVNSTENIETILDNINAITKNYYWYLYPIDVFFIARILSNVEDINEKILEVCVSIVNDIMKISETVLRSSQETYNATNMILAAFNSISTGYNGPKEIYKDNVGLIIAVLTDTEVTGIALENCADRCNIILLYANSLLQTASLNKFDVELTLSSDLFKNLLNAKDEYYTPRMVLNFFYSNVLFVEKTISKNTSQIFGVHFPSYDQLLPSEVKLTINIHAGSTSDHSCVSWAFLNESGADNEGFWMYESRPRNSDTVTCNFYEQNYFTVAAGGVLENITQALEDVLDSSMSPVAKLYKAQDISYYYTQFQPYDIYIISCILLNCNELNAAGLDMVNVIVNNVLRTPEEVLIDSSNTYNALRQILRGINNITNFDNAREHAFLTDQFGFVICQLSGDLSSGVILTTIDIQCSYETNDSSFSYSDEVVASLILTKEVVTQIIDEGDNPIIIVSVFANTVFFNIDKVQNSTLVLGLAIPGIQEKLENDIVVMFNYSTYNKSAYDCGYWEDYKLWKVGDGEYKDYFKKCSYSEPTYFTLYENTGTEDSVNITVILTDILNANYTILERLNQTLQVVSTYWEHLKPNHIYLISRILSFVKEIDDATCVEIISNIINIIMNVSKEVLVESQDKYNATDWTIYQINRIAELIDENIQIKTNNFAIVVSHNISGVFIDNCTESGNLEVLSNNIKYSSLSKTSCISTALVFDDTLQEIIQKDSTSKVVVTVYFTNALFNENKESTYTNISPIIGVVIPSQGKNLNGSLLFYYNSNINKTEVCAFWNYKVDEGGMTKGHWERDNAPAPPSQLTICESKQTKHFALLQIEKNITSDLESILNSNSTVEEKLEQVAVIITDLVLKLTPVDIYLISQILEIAMENINIYKMNVTSKIISALFHVPRDILRESQLTYYATDKILYTVEEMARGLNITDIDPIVHDNFTVAVYDLKDTNITGILLEDCNDTQCSISLLRKTVNFTDLIKYENVQTVIALSEELLSQIRLGDSPSKLVVTIYFSDVFFNEPTEREERVSMVCGVLLPGFSDTFLGNLYVAFNGASEGNYSSSCAFWNFQVEDGEAVLQGSWKPEVDPRNKKHFRICEFDHITHFALLLAKNNDSFSNANKYKILDIITGANSILSIIGIFGILLTAALFERWRRNTGNQILIHFSIAMSIKMIMLYVSAGVYDDGVRRILCSITGAILHYAILSEFCWMLIIAILQFKRFVEVLGGPPKFVLLKACICGWVFPILPVMLIFLIDRDNYTEGNAGLCYPSGLGLYLGIWLPIIIIVTINFVIFIFIVYNVFHKKTESRDIVNHEILFQWRLALLLFSMLGLTWLFGFMAQIPGAENIFVFLFCISATLQGFIMFLFFIVFNKSTRFLYSQSIKLWLFDRGYKIH